MLLNVEQKTLHYSYEPGFEMLAKRPPESQNEAKKPPIHLASEDSPIGEGVFSFPLLHYYQNKKVNLIENVKAQTFFCWSGHHGAGSDPGILGHPSLASTLGGDQ